MQTDFAGELRQTIAPLRRAIQQMLVEWGQPPTASALHKLSGAGQTICWQVFRIANATDVAAEARHAPSPAALKRLLAAAESAGVATATLQTVRVAAEQFRAFMQNSAGDRAAFDSMTAGVVADESAEKILHHHLRNAYRSMSHLWGVQTDLVSIAAVLRRSTTGPGVDDISLAMQRGVRRLRSGNRITLFGYHKNASGAATAAASMRPIDPEAAAQYGLPIWPEYCSTPLPQFDTVELPSGWVLKNLAGEEIGLKGSIDCTFAHTRQNASLMTDVDGRQLFHLTFANFRKPVALLVLDMLIHRESLPGIKPEMMVFQHIEGDSSQAAARSAQQFPIDERVCAVGRGDVVRLTELPAYQQILRKAADVVGWDLSEFDAYRLRVPYPILGTSARLFFYV